MEKLTLFEVAQYTVVADLPPGVSPRVRLTQKNRALIDRGFHPATHLPLLEDSTLTCGACARSVNINGFWKCRSGRLGLSSCMNSDIRKSWPACSVFRPNE